MEREGAGGVGDLVGKAEARVVRGASQVIRGLSIGFKSVSYKLVLLGTHLKKLVEGSREERLKFGGSV